MRRRLVCQSPGVCSLERVKIYLSIFSSRECLCIHLGAPQSANLGDGNGFVNQTVKHTSTLESTLTISLQIELRQDYSNAGIGTCLESLIGGNHFRWVDYTWWLQNRNKTEIFVLSVFRQNGPAANTGALFLAWAYSVSVRITRASYDHLESHKKMSVPNSLL